MYGALLLLNRVALALVLNYEDPLADFPLVGSDNTPDADLMEELASFVSDAGVRRGTRGTPSEARRYHTYILKEEHVYKDKILDLMKQVLYAAQDHMGELSPVLDKHRNDPAFRMKFIINKLQQYIVDMRRIYTLAVRGGVGVTVGDHVRLYQHLARKHVDVIYVVDHVIAAHGSYMESLLQQEAALRQVAEPAVEHELTRPTPGGQDVEAPEQRPEEVPRPEDNTQNEMPKK